MNRVLLLLLAAAQAASAQEARSVFSALDTGGRTVAVGQEVEGTLTDGDVLSAGGRRVQVWTLGAAVGQEVQIDLRSSDFDPFLYVVGPGLNEGLRDDDGGSGLNARICFTPDRPGEYRVVTASLGGQTGGFTLSAVTTDGACGGAAVTRDVDDLTALPLDGRMLSVGDDVQGALTPADATFYGSPAQAWAVNGVAGAPFSVDLRSDDFDAFLTVLGPGMDEWLTDDDGAGRCDARVSFTFPEDGEYRVVVSTLGAGMGAFRLIAGEAPGPVDPESCIPPSTVDQGGVDSVEGTLDDVAVVGALDLEATVSGALVGDEILFRDRPLQGWTLEGMAGTRVAVTLVSDQFDTYLFFDGPGFAEPLYDDDGAGDLDSRICVELPETGTYRVFAGPLYRADPGVRYTLEATVRRADELCGGSFSVSPRAVAGELVRLAAGAPEIGVNEERAGTLTGAFFHPESERPLDPWVLRGEPGTFLYVDVVSDVFDAYLYAWGEGFDEIAYADDAGGTTNARLELTIPADGRVYLFASAFGSGRGDYLIRAATNPPPLEARTGAPGTTATGTGVDPAELEGLGAPVGELPFGAEITASLEGSDPAITRGYAKAYEYRGEAGEVVVFEVVSDEFDTYLYLSGPGLGGVLGDDDSAGNLDSRIEVTLPETGTYTVVVSALGEGATGVFRLRAFRPVR